MLPWLVTLGGLAVSVAANVGHVTMTDLATKATAAVPPLAAATALAVGLGIRPEGLPRAEVEQRARQAFQSANEIRARRLGV